MCIFYDRVFNMKYPLHSLIISFQVKMWTQRQYDFCVNIYFYLLNCLSLCAIQQMYLKS